MRSCPKTSWNLEVLVDSAITDGDKYWTTLRNMRSVSKAFYRVVNAKLDALLAELKTRRMRRGGSLSSWPRSIPMAQSILDG
eukprot:1866366-Prymnesium_polylepis.1